MWLLPVKDFADDIPNKCVLLSDDCLFMRLSKKDIPTLKRGKGP